MKSFGLTDQGKTRMSNQDAWTIQEDGKGNFLALVCDGVGGGNHGETASRLSVEHMIKRFSENEGFRDPEDAQAWLYSSIRQTNDLVFRLGREQPEYQGMGTTLVAFLRTKFGSLIANVGDSRAYGLFSDGTFQAITTDHSYVARLVQSGQISEEQAQHHPQRHVITNAVGIWDNLKVDFFPVDEQKTEKILLCTDGLHDYVGEEAIAQAVQDDSAPLEEQARRLIRSADEVGGFDNVTVILIQLKEADGHE